ncbi:MAG: lysophospholipid acyltransferase family protein [Pseudomonadota bacterium]
MRIFIIGMLLRLSARLPLPLLHVLGSGFGWLLLLIPNRIRKIARRNIEQCFPDWSRRRQRHLLRQSLMETARTLTETGALWLLPGEQALRLIRNVDGSELVTQARQQGRGVILATPHLGAWEAAGLYGAATFRMTCLYRPLRIPELETLVCDARSRLGAEYVTAAANGIRELYRVLESGGTVAMLPDQEPPLSANGIFAPFFGINAWSTVLLARLAQRTGAPVIMAWCERLPGGSGYHLHFRPGPQGINSADLDTAVSAMNHAVEQLVRECPAQYQWGYRRFKTRPAGETPFY